MTVAKASIAPEMLSVVDFGLRLITAGFGAADRDRIVAMASLMLQRAIEAGDFTRAAWDAGALSQASIDALVSRLDQHRLDRAAIDALLRHHNGAGAALYAYLAHTVLVASAIAASRTARRPGARQIWRRHLLTGSSDGQARLISSAAPAWAVAG